tara:strand:- start:88 stop:867 length:780 start_codon:yes stop_codon:yes gene_type:complete
MIDTLPVLGVPVLNGTHWLKNQIDSVDFPIENYVIINNGGPTIYKEIQEIIAQPHQYIQNFHVNNMVYNIGVAPAWNLVIKSFMHSPYWMIVNHDVSFESGFLKEMFEAAQIENIKLIFGKGGDGGRGSFDLFLMKSSLIQSHGFFDENFYPAYCEDIDYIMRLINKPVDTINFINKKYYHGNSLDYNKTGSQTRKNDEKLGEKIVYAWGRNREYLLKKWGPNVFENKPYKTPFNIDGLSIKTTTFDLDFCKDKHLTKK